MTHGEDFIVLSSGHVIFRIHMTAQSMVITFNEDGFCGLRQVIVADVTEARELCDWITDQLDPRH